MSFDWKQLENAVTTAVRSGKIGVPRALRVTLHDKGETPSQLSIDVISAASVWFEGDPASSWSNESDANVRVVMAKWSNGSTALVSISCGQQGSNGGDFTLLGSKGSIYHRLGGVSQ